MTLVAVKTMREVRVCVVMIYAADMLVLALDSQPHNGRSHTSICTKYMQVIRVHPCRSLPINFHHYLASVFLTCTHHLPGEKPQKHPLPLPAGKSDVPRHAATTAFSQHTAVDGIRFVQLITLEPATGNPSKVGINRYPIGTMFVYMICTYTFTLKIN